MLMPLAAHKVTPLALNRLPMQILALVFKVRRMTG
jgi:hypothetical protein